MLETNQLMYVWMAINMQVCHDGSVSAEIAWLEIGFAHQAPSVCITLWLTARCHDETIGWPYKLSEQTACHLFWRLEGIGEKLYLQETPDMETEAKCQLTTCGEWIFKTHQNLDRLSHFDYSHGAGMHNLGPFQ